MILKSLTYSLKALQLLEPPLDDECTDVKRLIVVDTEFLYVLPSGDIAAPS